MWLHILDVTLILPSYVIGIQFRQPEVLLSVTCPSRKFQIMIGFLWYCSSKWKIIRHRLIRSFVQLSSENGSWYIMSEMKQFTLWMHAFQNLHSGTGSWAYRQPEAMLRDFSIKVNLIRFFHCLFCLWWLSLWKLQDCNPRPRGLDTLMHRETTAFAHFGINCQFWRSML